MDLGQLIRAARQHAGISQRELAARAAVSATAVADIESGRRDARWGLVQQLLRAAERDVALSPREAVLDARTEAWLWQSTSQRLYLSMGGRSWARWDSHFAPFRELAELASGRVVVLSPEASLGVWLPGVPTPDPVPVTVLLARNGQGRDAVAGERVQLSVGPVSMQGLVRVGVSSRRQVLVHPPSSPLMTGMPGYGPVLRAVATALDAQQRRDAAERRPAAHLPPRVQYEHDWVMGLRRYGDKRRVVPDPRDRRDWRLGGEASFRDWLELRQYPLPDRLLPKARRRAAGINEEPGDEWPEALSG